MVPIKAFMVIQAVGGRILAIEDDTVLLGHIQSHLHALGYDVEASEDGEQGLGLARSSHYDVVLMDIMLPSRSGLDVLSLLRKQSSVPVVLMSALGDEEHRIHGYSQGADDFLPKPFSLNELQVRIEAVLRRVRYERQHVLNKTSLGGLSLDRNLREVRYLGLKVQLTDYEFRLLQVLIDSAGETLSKAYLYQEVLRRPLTQHDRGLDMHVSHLRRKLRSIEYLEGAIETVWGAGYRYRQGGSGQC